VRERLCFCGIRGWWLGVLGELRPRFRVQYRGGFRDGAVGPLTGFAKFLGIERCSRGRGIGPKDFFEFAGDVGRQKKSWKAAESFCRLGGIEEASRSFFGTWVRRLRRGSLLERRRRRVWGVGWCGPFEAFFGGFGRPVYIVMAVWRAMVT